MLVNAQSIQNIFTGYKAAFGAGFAMAPPDYKKIAMVVPSGVREEVYAWLGTFPRLRQWLGDRVIQSLTMHGDKIVNRRFESTFELDIDDIKDDQYGVLAPMVQELGASAAAHPTELTLDLLASGFVAQGYDKQPFFSATHPSFDQSGQAITVSNMQTGTGPAWFLFDTTRPFRALIYQEREPYRITMLNYDGDYNVFMKNRLLFGVTGRSNAGFGLWQLAFGSMAPLTTENYEAARTAMTTLCGEGGRKLNINPSLLVVPRALEGDGRRILISESRPITVTVGTGTPAVQQAVAVGNEWKGSAELLATSYL